MELLHNKTVIDKALFDQKSYFYEIIRLISQE